MPLTSLILSILHRKGRTLSIELREFGDFTHMDSSISKVGYLKQRMKLNPDALKYLNAFHVRNIYDEVPLQSINGYFILAADGTDISVPTTEETLSKYGTKGYVKSAKQTGAIAGVACLYDVLNNIILSCDVTKGNFDEMKYAFTQMNDVSSVIGDKKSILILDRGYPSLPYFLKMIKMEQKFVVRLCSTDYVKEQNSMTSDDQNVDVIISSSRINKHKGKEYEQELRDADSITMRFVKIHFDNGMTECIVTNLSPEEFDTKAIGELYIKRWCIETVYDMLKNNLELGNFTGTKYILIEQDIYCCVYLCNIAQDMIAEAQEEFDKDNIKNYKHKMAINKTFAVGIMKDQLLKVILEKNSSKKARLYMNMIKEMKKEIVPIRPERHYERSKHNNSSKYNNTHKRAY